MPSSQYVGKAGHLAVMSEFCLRGYNAATPEIDIGDDVFVVNDRTGNMWRVQVKTSRGRQQRTSRAYQFRIRNTAITAPQNPQLHFVFVMREHREWRFLIIDRAVLANYVNTSAMGTAGRDYRQFNFTLHVDNRAICSGTDLTHHLDDWSNWPPI